MGALVLEVEPSNPVKGIKGMSKAKFKTEPRYFSSLGSSWANSWRVAVLTQTTASRKIHPEIW